MKWSFRDLFERQVTQVLTGILGRYVKNIQKDQLKIGLEGVLLEDVELSSEAFDYLQLPFVLKHGRIGRLSINIPWKKLGRDPIIIVLENVFISACPRDDCEWNSDLVARREIAGKKAKLAAAELAKLSRRVNNDRAGKSFLSYIIAWILDGIQVSVHNVHVMYVDQLNDKANFLLGLRLSGLQVLTDTQTKLQNTAGSYTGRFRGGQVNKIVKLSSLGIYCQKYEESSSILATVAGCDSNCWDKGFDSSNFDYIVEPFDAVISLMVNKLGKIEKDVPQYTISADLTGLVILLNGTQLLCILLLVDYFDTCALREKYGRYRPSQCSLLRKERGWQRLWWHYALDSVQSDIRKRLYKTSWSSFGQRITCQHKYVTLYKKKLLCLFRDQLASEDILQKLEEMEKDSDVDDILNYRAIAEVHLQDYISNHTSADRTGYYLDGMDEKLPDNDVPLNRQRGWLNWLSLGMLGAGGTENSGQFSGVISDAVVKDIYEATKFHPLSDGDCSMVEDKHFVYLTKISIQQIFFKLRNCDKEVVNTMLHEASVEWKLWEDSMTVVTMLNSVEINDARSRTLLFRGEKVNDENLSDYGSPFIEIHIASPRNNDFGLSVKVALQPFEAVYSPNIMLDLLNIYQVWKSFQFQHNRVLASLNQFEDTRTRLLSKADYLCAKTGNMALDVNFSYVTIRVPWNKNSESYCAVLKFGSLSFKSLSKKDVLDVAHGDYISYLSTNILNSDLNIDTPLSYQLSDLYDHYKIDLCDAEVNLVIPDLHDISVLEKSTVVLTLGTSIFPDETSLKQLEVICVGQQLVVSHFSFMICNVLVELAAFLDLPTGTSSSKKMNRTILNYSVSLDLSHVTFHICLDSVVENSVFLNISLENLTMRYDQQNYVEYLIFAKSIEVSACGLTSEPGSCTVLSCKNPYGVESWTNFECKKNDGRDSQENFIDGCFLLLYKSCGGNIDNPNHTLSFDNIELHCYPKLVGILQAFYRMLVELFKQPSISSTGNSFGSRPEIVDWNVLKEIKLQSFGFSNYHDIGSSLFSGIAIYNFPFIAVRKLVPFGNLDNSENFSTRQREQLPCTKNDNFISNKRKKPTLAKLSSRRRVKSGFSSKAELFCFNLHLSGVRIHFHDATCIVGTVTVPNVDSAVIGGPDSWNILLSTIGLRLSSPWSTSPTHDFLFGPASQDYSSVVNLRVQKGVVSEQSPKIEVCIGIQNVSCTLSAEFLAILIGYFSLSDWTSYKKEQVAAEGHEDGKSSPTYKFEILDSYLIFPVEGNASFFVKLELCHLYFGFILKSSCFDKLEGVPEECIISINQDVDKVDMYNVFGRKISISVLIVDKRQEPDPESDSKNFCLVPQLDVDMWLRIPLGEGPHDSSPFSTAIMMMVECCQINAEENFLLCAFEAILDVVNEISNVGRESECYTADILQFKLLRKNLKEAVTAGAFGSSSTETYSHIKFLIKSLSIKFLKSETKISSPLNLVAEAQMHLSICGLLRNDLPISLDATLSSLRLYSVLNHINLALLNGSNEASTVLSVHFSENKSELSIGIPSLEVWLHLSDWVELISLLGCYNSYSRNSLMVVPSDTAYLVPDLSVHESEIKAFSAEDPVQSFHWILKSEEIGIDFHLPVWTKPEVLEQCKDFHGSLTDKNAHFERRDCKNISVSVNSRKTEIDIGGNMMKFNATMNSLSGKLEVVHNQAVRSIPFFQLAQFNVVGEIYQSQKSSDIVCDVYVENLEVLLSLHVLYFWHDVKASSLIESSQTLFHCMEFNIFLNKASLLLSDQMWNCKGPFLEILVKNVVLHGNVLKHCMKVSFKGYLLVSYMNLDKVMWEPFIEPWMFELELNRQYDRDIAGSSSFMTDIGLKSTSQLNLNLTEPLIESLFHVSKMLNMHWNQSVLDNLFFEENVVPLQASDGDYAPYVLQNDTSIPLIFWVSSAPSLVDNIDFRLLTEGTRVQPASSFPIYIDEISGDKKFHRPGHSSESLSEKKSSGFMHHMVSIQLEGTSRPSFPMSMDLVGVSYFEVNFSKTHNLSEIDTNGVVSTSSKAPEEHLTSSGSDFVVPVVFEVSMQHRNKLIRIYSTVVIVNDTSVPVELRFDIPFSVSPKVLDPIHPGTEIPLPVHLTRSGCMRLRPHGKSYLWSEAHSLPNILAQESRVGFLRSLVCYPSHPSSDLFRCCLSIRDVSLLYLNNQSHSSFHTREATRDALDLSKLKKHFLHQVKLTTPLLVKNYLPKPLSLTIEIGGIMYTEFLPEVATASVFHIDSTNDLGINLSLEGFTHVVIEFPRAEIFSLTAKLQDSKFSLVETFTMFPDEPSGPLCIKVEKMMDAFCGARELHVSVPLLLYNCSGLPLSISKFDAERTEELFILHPCYHLTDKMSAGKSGLRIFSTNEELSSSAASNNDNVISVREHFTGSKLDFSKKFGSGYDSIEQQKCRNVRPYMYSPQDISPASELMVRLSLYNGEKNPPWSSPFYLVSPGGSTVVAIPKPQDVGAFLVTVTSSPIVGVLSGRTRAVTFQPRFVISNACSKDLWFRQKGTDKQFLLGVAQHSHLHWTDASRDLLVTIQFNEPGWQWSGSFLPDCLGDAQVKMHHSFTGMVKMVRVEILNANILTGEEKAAGSSSEQSGTYLVLLSDDDSGFMPYRIDNFSMERLRVYQQNCDTFATIVHPYTSCPYAWDEPWYPHRLAVEVPGERVVGMYGFDDIREYAPVYLRATSGKPERRLFFTIHAEGAIKVLTVVDARYHVPNVMKRVSFAGFKEKKGDDLGDSTLKITESVHMHFSSIGISLINSSPQELLFASVKDVKLELLQSLDRQKVSCEVWSLQIDNQLHGVSYPVMLSFEREHRGSSSVSLKMKDERAKVKDGIKNSIIERMEEPVLCFTSSKWRSEDVFLVSFEYITLLLAPSCIELEEQLLLSIIDFSRNASLRLKSKILRHSSYNGEVLDNDPEQFVNVEQDLELKSLEVSKLPNEQKGLPIFPSVLPVGAPWQKIYLFAKRQKKIYVELLTLAPLRLTVSFSSSPWLNGQMGTESPLFLRGTAVQRGLMALADVEGAPVFLKQLTLAHHMASWQSTEEIIIRHYMRQFLHEMYKVFGSAGVIGNPMGFARNVGVGIKDFVSVPAKSIFQSPSELMKGVALGTKSLVSNTVYAVSNATTQFSKAAHKGIVAFTFDEHDAAKQREKLDTHNRGFLNELLEGLTGLLQSPIEGAEKHGLPGVFSGIAVGTAGLVARPVASILEVTGKTAQSIRNQISPHQSRRFRARFPRPLARDRALLPYSWEDAIGVAMLLEAEDGKFKDEIFVLCKQLKHPGKFVVITEKLFIIFSSTSLVGFESPDFCGTADPEWTIESEMRLEDVVHIDRIEEAVNIVGSNPDNLLKHHQLKRSNTRLRQYEGSNSLPLSMTSIELSSREEAENVLEAVLHLIQLGKKQRWGSQVLHRTSLR